MKLAFKIILIILFSILVITLSTFLYFYYSLRNVNIEENKLIDLNKTISFYSIDEKQILEQSNQVQVTDISKIPEHVKNAFIAIEDKRFYSHNGIDYKGLGRAMISNLKSFSFKE